MAQETRGEEGAAAAWLAHAVHVNYIDYSLENLVFLFMVVEPTLVNALPQELNRWLCTILLLHRHIKIIHK